MRILDNIVAIATIPLIFALACEPKAKDCPEPEVCPECPEPEDCPEPPEPEPAPEEPLAAAFSLAPATSWPSEDATPRPSACRTGGELRTIGAFACCCYRHIIVFGVWIPVPEFCVCGGGDLPDLGGGGACFPAGTPISLADGSTRAIEELSPGDEVMSVDPETKQLVKAKVLALETVEDAKVAVVNIDGLRVSADHPLVAGDHLIMAGRLEPGDEIYRLAGDQTRSVGDTVELVPIESIDRPRGEPEAALLYALDVDGSNTYFARGTLAHEKAH